MKNKAFTLVELLVVIGIITILIGLLMPALAAARQQANSTVCLSNLRQLGIAAQQYTVQFKGYYPLAKDATGDWDFRVDGGVIGPGILWTGQTNPRIQQCPSCDVKSPTPTDPYTGYNYNISYIGHGVGEARVASAKASQVRRPSQVALFGDGEYFGGTNKFMRAPAIDTPVIDGDSVIPIVRASGTQGYRHRGKTNVVFCDGHAESVTDRFTVTKPTPAPVAKNCGFLSADNSRYAIR